MSKTEKKPLSADELKRQAKLLEANARNVDLTRPYRGLVAHFLLVKANQLIETAEAEESKEEEGE